VINQRVSPELLLKKEKEQRNLRRRHSKLARDRQTTLPMPKTEAKPNRNLRWRLVGDLLEHCWKFVGDKELMETP
jgi:hypothetical protein